MRVIDMYAEIAIAILPVKRQPPQPPYLSLSGIDLSTSVRYLICALDDRMSDLGIKLFNTSFFDGTAKVLFSAWLPPSKDDPAGEHEWMLYEVLCEDATAREFVLHLDVNNKLKIPDAELHTIHKQWHKALSAPLIEAPK